jgi:hypothetical protein
MKSGTSLEVAVASTTGLQEILESQFEYFRANQNIEEESTQRIYSLTDKFAKTTTTALNTENVFTTFVSHHNRTISQYPSRFERGKLISLRNFFEMPFRQFENLPEKISKGMQHQEAEYQPYKRSFEPLRGMWEFLYQQREVMARTKQLAQFYYALANGDPGFSNDQISITEAFMADTFFSFGQRLANVYIKSWIQNNRSKLVPTILEVERREKITWNESMRTYPITAFSNYQTIPVINFELEIARIALEDHSKSYAAAKEVYGTINIRGALFPQL